MALATIEEGTHAACFSPITTCVNCVDLVQWQYTYHFPRVTARVTCPRYVLVGPVYSPVVLPRATEFKLSDQHDEYIYIYIVVLVVVVQPTHYQWKKLQSEFINVKQKSLPGSDESVLPNSNEQPQAKSVLTVSMAVSLREKRNKISGFG